MTRSVLGITGYAVLDHLVGDRPLRHGLYHGGDAILEPRPKYPEVVSQPLLLGLHTRLMMVSLRVANMLLVFMSALFAMSLATNVVFVLESYMGLLLAGQVVSAATRPEQLPKWVR